MKTIKIIDTLHLDENGVQAKTANGRLQTVHLRQGDLDGACAVYSTLMSLIIIGAVKYSDIKMSGNEYDKRYSIEKLKKELLEIRGLHRDGNYFSHQEEDNIKTILERTYSKKTSVQHFDQNPLEHIKINIENSQPVLISISYKGGGSHALVAIGVECDKNDELTKILCLDPGYPSPKFTYWNSVIDLKMHKGKYPYRNMTESGDTHFIALNDILIITKKI